jgi:CheY-like chemotaxis protein
MSTHEDCIRMLAYNLWDEAGRSDGDDVKFWYLAEQVILGEGQDNSLNQSPNKKRDITIPKSLPPKKAALSGYGANRSNHNPGPRGAKLVVVVDDNAQIRELLGLALKAIGIDQVVMAINGEEAISVLRNVGADIVIMDKVMDVMDGLECTKRIRSGVEGINPQIPIILLTGVTGGDSEGDAYAAGVDLFIGKPFSVRKISSGVSKLLCLA